MISAASRTGQDGSSAAKGEASTATDYRSSLTNTSVAADSRMNEPSQLVKRLLAQSPLRGAQQEGNPNRISVDYQLNERNSDTDYVYDVPRSPAEKATEEQGEVVYGKIPGQQQQRGEMPAEVTAPVSEAPAKQEIHPSVTKAKRPSDGGELDSSGGARPAAGSEANLYSQLGSFSSLGSSDGGGGVRQTEQEHSTLTQLWGAAERARLGERAAELLSCGGAEQTGAAELIKHRWFHGDISRQDAETRLLAGRASPSSEGQSNLFLVRQKRSSTTKTGTKVLMYVVSVLAPLAPGTEGPHGETNVVVHHLVSQAAMADGSLGTYFLVNNMFRLRECQSIVSVVLELSQPTPLAGQRLTELPYLPGLPLTEACLLKKGPRTSAASIGSVSSMSATGSLESSG